ncbi:MAG: DUF4190 domain-containing protein [Phycisphaerae bacterium]|nr:DUF4190 domain-containing protein [Phycisphaerae bacterium]MDW8262559.1 DUF4190 domain-containing protein [Phycisphaerales bacterium]
MRALGNQAEQTGASPGASQDPLSSLYRMSRTAGLASSDYKAVNVCSVVAVVGGLLSFLANFDTVLLIIPLTALTLGIVGLVQIARSNGTQTGTPLALAGIVLSLGLGAWAATAQYREAARTASDRAALVALVDQLWQCIRDNRLEQAYALFSETFRQRVDRKAFDDPWNFYRQRNPLERLESTGLFVFESDPLTDMSFASGQIIIRFQQGETRETRVRAVFSRRQGQWKIEALPDFYPLPRGAGN